jgi:hypothetical protein
VIPDYAEIIIIRHVDHLHCCFHHIIVSLRPYYTLSKAHLLLVYYDAAAATSIIVFVITTATATVATTTTLPFL